MAPIPLDFPPSISILVGDLSPKGAGRWGGAVRPFLLAQALQRLGCAVEILGFTDDPSASLPPTPFPIYPFPYRPYPQFFWPITQLLRRAQGDILYAYKTKASSFGVGLLGKRLLRRPLLLDIDDWEMSWHGGDRWRYTPTWRQRYRDWVKPHGAHRYPDHPYQLHRMEQQVHRADARTLHTQFLQTRFGGTYIPNGKDTDHFDPSRYDAAASRRRYGLEGYRILMFPGAPRPYKGLETILKAIAHRNEPDLKLVIVGGSPYDDYDQTLKHKWGQLLISLPKIPHSQMPEVIAAADIIVVPQEDTPAAQAQFPLKLTDGMAMAKPILATQVGDIPSILGSTGYLVPPGDSLAMAAKIGEIFAQPNAAQAKGHQARLRCIHAYSINAMAEGLAPLIAQLGQARSRPRLRSAAALHP